MTKNISFGTLNYAVTRCGDGFYIKIMRKIAFGTDSGKKFNKYRDENPNNHYLFSNSGHVVLTSLKTGILEVQTNIQILVTCE